MLSRLHPDRRLSVALALVVALSVATPAMSAPNDSSSPFPGLELVDSKSLDKLYRRPDMDTSEYDKVLIGEPVVEFSKNWKPRNYGTYGLSAAQVKRIRLDLSALAKSTFAKVLGAGGYEVVTTPGDGVLEVTPNIVNLFINAPDTSRAGRVNTYVLDAGSMTLALQVNDAVTGTLLAVAYDSRTGKPSGPPQGATEPRLRRSSPIGPSNSKWISTRHGPSSFVRHRRTSLPGVVVPRRFCKRMGALRNLSPVSFSVTFCEPFLHQGNSCHA
jgi:hypothetical protein